MTLADVIAAFGKEVSRPSEVQGDSWGIDATTEDILRLVNTPYGDLRPDDFLGYLGYCNTGGDDDLRFLFPAILRIWEEELSSRDGWFTQHFHAEVCRTDFIERALGARLREVVLGFMRRALSDRLASESSLRVIGASTSHDWFGHLASFGVYAAIEPLWSEIWRASRPGHAVALLQYLSCLICDPDNPVFAAWTCDAGGGSPELWGYDSVGFDESWRLENSAYLSSALTSGTIRGCLRRISSAYGNEPSGKLAALLRRNLDAAPGEVDLRCRDLVAALSRPSGAEIVSWESLLTDRGGRPGGPAGEGR